MTIDQRALIYSATSLAWVATSVACGGGAGPQFEPSRTDRAGASISASSPARPTPTRLALILVDVARGDQIRKRDDHARADRLGCFKWTPLATTCRVVQIHRDGGGSSRPHGRIDVASRPLGDPRCSAARLGAPHLELAVTGGPRSPHRRRGSERCQVRCRRGEPKSEGAELDQRRLSQLHGARPAPRTTRDRYNLRCRQGQLEPQTMKKFLVVMRGTRANCPGASPVTATRRHETRSRSHSPPTSPMAGPQSAAALY